MLHLLCQCPLWHHSRLIYRTVCFRTLRKWSKPKVKDISIINISGQLSHILVNIVVRYQPWSESSIISALWKWPLMFSTNKNKKKAPGLNYSYCSYTVWKHWLCYLFNLFYFRSTFFPQKTLTLDKLLPVVFCPDRTALFLLLNASLEQIVEQVKLTLWTNRLAVLTLGQFSYSWRTLCACSVQRCSTSHIIPNRMCLYLFTQILFCR